jgi:hypothetical protein
MGVRYARRSVDGIRLLPGFKRGLSIPLHKGRGKPRSPAQQAGPNDIDASTDGGIMDLLKSLNENQQLTIVMVTHDESIAAQAHRTVRLAQGRIQTVGREDAA